MGPGLTGVAGIPPAHAAAPPLDHGASMRPIRVSRRPWTHPVAGTRQALYTRQFTCTHQKHDNAHEERPTFA